MAIKFRCPECAVTLVAPDDMVGRRMRCGACRAVFPVPELPAQVVDSEPRRGDTPPDDERRSRRAGNDRDDRDRDDEYPRPREYDGDPYAARRQRRPPQARSGYGVLFWLAIVFGGLIFLGIACCGGGYLLLPGEQWRRHQSQEGGFAVELPAAPQKDMPVPGVKPEPGQKVEGAVLWKRGEFYVITYMPILPRSARAESDEAILDQAIKEMRAEPGVRVLRTEDITVSGFPAREIEYTADDGGNYVGRLVVADSRFYILVAGGRFVSAGNKNIRRFLDSFEVTDPALEGAPGQKRKFTPKRAR
jgi:hypothetical protein